MKKLFLILLFVTLSALLSACAGGAGVATSWPGLAVDQNTAYLANNQHIYAIDLANGTEKWRFPVEANNRISFFATPSVAPEGQLLAGGFDHVLYSLNPTTGAENWRFARADDRYVGSSLATEQGIFAPNADGHLYALDLSGNLRWSFSTERSQWAQPVADPECECIYLPSMDHRLYSVDAQTGNRNWSTESLGGALVGRPAYSDEGVLYVGTFKSEMLAIDAQDGAIRWRFPTSGWVWGGPALREDHLFFGDLSGAFYAVDAATGQEVWKTQADGLIAETPLLTDDTIYFTTEAGTLYGVDFNGTITLNKPVGGRLYTPPVLAGDDTLLVAPLGADALLYAFDLSGNQKWTPFKPE